MERDVPTGATGIQNQTFYLLSCARAGSAMPSHSLCGRPQGPKRLFSRFVPCGLPAPIVKWPGASRAGRKYGFPARTLVQENHAPTPSGLPGVCPEKRRHAYVVTLQPAATSRHLRRRQRLPPTVPTAALGEHGCRGLRCHTVL